MTKVSMNLAKDFKDGICYTCKHYEYSLRVHERHGHTAWIHKCHADEMPAEGKCHCPKYEGKVNELLVKNPDSA